MQGQSLLLSHALMVGLSVVLVLAVTVSFGAIRRDYQEFLGTSQAEQVCMLVRTGIEHLYHESVYRSPMTTLTGSVQLTLPERLGDVPYRISFQNRTVRVTTATGAANASCPVGFETQFTGFSTGGTTVVRLTEFANGTRRVSMERVV